MSELIAYETVPAEGFALTPAPPRRDWMDTTHDRHAYRCLPMLMANQAGWLISCPATVRMRWNGSPLRTDIEMQAMQTDRDNPVANPEYCYPASHFGQGIVTWTLPWLFRTPPGYNLLVRGPANRPKDGIAALEGLVETDWTPATFTMNWQITRPGHWVTFYKGEPITMIMPVRRGELEEFTPRIQPITDDPELASANAAWCKSRDAFHAAFAASGEGWQRHYHRGTAPDGAVAPDHQIRLQLRPFTR